MSKYDCRRKGPRLGDAGGTRGSGEPFWIKDISGFFKGSYPRDPEKVVVVDDNIVYYVNHLRNVVPVRAFQGDPNDDELKTLAAFLKLLAGVEDVREDIKKRCDLLAHVGSDVRPETSSSEENEEVGPEHMVQVMEASKNSSRFTPPKKRKKRASLLRL